MSYRKGSSPTETTAERVQYVERHPCFPKDNNGWKIKEEKLPNIVLTYCKVKAAGRQRHSGCIAGIAAWILIISESAVAALILINWEPAACPSLSDSAHSSTWRHNLGSLIFYSCPEEVSVLPLYKEQILLWFPHTHWGGGRDKIKAWIRWMTSPQPSRSTRCTSGHRTQLPGTDTSQKAILRSSSCEGIHWLF